MLDVGLFEQLLLLGALANKRLEHPLLERGMHAQFIDDLVAELALFALICGSLKTLDQRLHIAVVRAQHLQCICWSRHNFLQIKMAQLPYMLFGGTAATEFSAPAANRNFPARLRPALLSVPMGRRKPPLQYAPVGAGGPGAAARCT